MNQLPKVVNLIPPVAIVDNASWTTTEIDTKGFDLAILVFHLGATDIAATALAVTESDSAGSGHANVTGLIFGTSTNKAGATSALPSATDDGKSWMFAINLKGRKRYLDLTATNGDGSAGGFASGTALLYRADNSPETAAACGCEEILEL